MSSTTALDIAFAEEVKKTCPPSLSYLVAVSGGRDSMALLHYLHGAGYREIVVVHVNHGMRGEASDGDERFVLDEAKRLGYQAATRRADVAGYAAKEKLSLESAARSLRYEAFG